MPRTLAERDLSTNFDENDEVEFIDLEEDEEDELPHLVFLIPGIRTDGRWAQELRFSAQTWAGHPIVCRPVRGNGRYADRLSVLHLVTRFGLRRFRKNFVSQIAFGLTQYEALTVNIIAHSMGSALLSEIIEDVDKSIRETGKSLNTVVFLGSVCHRKHSEKIATRCNRFVNDVGCQDMWPYRASIVNPFTYGDVGTRGFLDGYVYMDRFFNHNHTSCTELSHIKDKVIPLIETDDLIEHGVHNSSLAKNDKSDNYYVYLRRAIWIGVIIAAVWLSVR